MQFNTFKKGGQQKPLINNKQSNKYERNRQKKVGEIDQNKVKCNNCVKDKNDKRKERNTK